MNNAANTNPGSSSNVTGGGSPLDCCDWGAISQRVKAVLADPVGIWPTIKDESKSIKEIYLSYVIPLVVIGMCCSILGGMFSGGGFFAPIVNSIVATVIQLASIIVLAYIYKFLAGTFDGNTNETLTFKLIAYSSTASYVGAFFSLIPSISIIGAIFSLYTLYTIFQGIPVMTGVTEKRIPYFIAAIIASIVTFFVCGLFVAMLSIGAVVTAAPVIPVQ